MKRRWNRLLAIGLAGILSISGLPAVAAASDQLPEEIPDSMAREIPEEPEESEECVTEQDAEQIPGLNNSMDSLVLEGAEENATETELVVELNEDLSGTELPDSQELFGTYVEQQFYGNADISYYGTYARDLLTGPDRNYYDLISDKIRQVAAGEIASTVFAFPTTEIMGQEVFYAADLGYDTVTADNAKAIASKALSYKRGLVMDALANDMPENLFWFDKASGGMKTSYTISYTSRYVRISTITVKMTVSRDYLGEEEYTVNAEKLQTVATAVTKAKEIVTEAENLTDLEKLYYYRSAICDLTSYNSAAAMSSYTGGYGDPWQLIWVFDGDPDTKVVCEGYAKAFQYLVDLTAFSAEEIRSILVTGKMSGGSHMWNILHMDDGRNYMVDVTNSDSLSSASKVFRFMQLPARGNASDGYIFSQGLYFNTLYTYDDDTRALYPQEDLKLSRFAYGEEEVPFGFEPVRSVQAGIRATAVFHVDAVAADYYQWEYSKNGTKWYTSSATGADTDTMSFTVSSSTAANQYRCRITAYDGSVYYTNTASIILAEGVNIVEQPVSGAVLMGESQIFTVKAENVADGGYQWQYSKDGMHWYTSYADGANTDTLTVKASGNSQGNRYRCVILGVDGNKKKSAAAAMIVLLRKPEDCAAKSGDTAHFSLQAEGISAYQWQYSKDGGASWYRSNADGADTDAVSFRVSASNRNNLYRCKLMTEDGAYAFTEIVKIR